MTELGVNWGDYMREWIEGIWGSELKGIILYNEVVNWVNMKPYEGMNWEVRQCEWVNWGNIWVNDYWECIIYNMSELGKLGNIWGSELRECEWVNCGIMRECEWVKWANIWVSELREYIIWVSKLRIMRKLGNMSEWIERMSVSELSECKGVNWWNVS